MKYLEFDVNFFSRPEIILIESMDNGSEHVYVLLKLMMIAANKGMDGALMITKDIPMTYEMIAGLVGVSVNEAKEAIEAFLRFGLITNKDGVFVMNDMPDVADTDEDF